MELKKDGQLGITIDIKVVEAKGKLSDGKAYVAYDVVRDYINSRFYWNSNGGMYCCICFRRI